MIEIWIMVITSIIIHEVAHYTYAKLRGYKPRFGIYKYNPAVITYFPENIFAMKDAYNYLLIGPLIQGLWLWIYPDLILLTFWLICSSHDFYMAYKINKIWFSKKMSNI